MNLFRKSLLTLICLLILLPPANAKLITGEGYGESLKLAREDAGKVIESINSKGFFIQMPPTVLATEAFTIKKSKLH